MSNEDSDAAFWTRTNALIDLANQQCDDASHSDVGNSLLYAASRFNAYIVALAADSREQMEANREEAFEYFTEQYKKMLTENLDEYIENYEQYVMAKDEDVDSPPTA